LAVAFAALEKEGTLFGDEEFKSGVVDDFDIDFDEREVGVDGEVDTDGARRAPAEVSTDLDVSVTKALGRSAASAMGRRKQALNRKNRSRRMAMTTVKHRSGQKVNEND
jgi:hypothetical protein